MDLQDGWGERENDSIEIHCVLLTQVGSRMMHRDGTWAKGVASEETAVPRSSGQGDPNLWV